MLKLNKFRLLFTGLMLWSMAITVLPSRAGAEEASSVHIYVQQELQQWEQQPFIKDGFTMVPMRALFEKLGFHVAWDAEKQMATAVKGGLTISLSINRGTALVNDVMYYLDVTPSLENGNTYMPLRFVSEAAGAEVLWNDADRSIQIQFENDPQKRIRRLIDNVVRSGSFTQAAMSVTGGDGIKLNSINVKENTIAASGKTAKVKFDADITVSKAVKNDKGITISPAETVVYEVTADMYKDAFDQWLLQTVPSKMTYVLKEKTPFINNVR
ncbi:copper amine oxidase N-terminal domain-containing protein [Paenibacillus piri]|nr:copper amine oxidase N-terminal domain-containing protein [Paenibacillus piri]